MSCKEQSTREKIISDLKGNISCATCHVVMELIPGELAFGNDMLTTWSCPKCKHDELLIIREDGSVMQFAKAAE